MKTNAEALGAIVGMVVMLIVAVVAVIVILGGTAVLAGLWFRVFLEVAGV